MYLFCRYLSKIRYQKSSCSEKVTVLKHYMFYMKSSCTEEIAAPKNCLSWSSYSEDVVLWLSAYCEEIASPKMKLSWKKLYKCKNRNCHLKKNPKWNLCLGLIEIIPLMFRSHYFCKFSKLYVSQTKGKCLNNCFLLLIFLRRSLFWWICSQLNRSSSRSLVKEVLLMVFSDRLLNY